MTEIEDLIRLGLRLLAEELEAPPATRAPRRRRRLVAVAVGLAVLIVAAALGVVERDGSRGAGVGSSTRASSAIPSTTGRAACPARSRGRCFGTPSRRS